jgi:hypothetical protein
MVGQVMTTVYDCEPKQLLVPVAVTVKLNVPVAVGVPVIAPVVVLSVRPVGSEPVLTE